MKQRKCLLPRIWLLLGAFLTLTACHLGKSQLVGSYVLVCEAGPIASEKLILHQDGTFEQHTVTKSNVHYDSATGKWQYLEETLKLDSRQAFVVGKRGLLEVTKNPEVLRVELSHPQIIHLERGCYYTQAK